MFASTVQTTIRKPINEVFAFVADARNRPQWDDTVISEELTSADPIGVGSTVRTRLRSMGREYTYTWVVTVHSAPSRMTIESVTGPLATTLDFAVSGDDRATSVTFTVTGRPTGAMKLLQPLLARSTQRNLDRNIDRLRQLLEHGAVTAGRKAGQAVSGESAGHRRAEQATMSLGFSRPGDINMKVVVPSWFLTSPASQRPTNRRSIP